MAERNTLPETPDRFEKELEARLKTWRAPAPPPRLKSRIAAEIDGAKTVRGPFPLAWRYAFMVGACAAAVVVALLCLSLQPQPSFAKVEEAMQSVRYLSYRSRNTRTLPDGSVEQDTRETWIRRNPPAFADRITRTVAGKKSGPMATRMRLRRVRDGRQEITLDELTGGRKVSPLPPRLDMAKSVAFYLYAFTRAGSDHPNLAALYEKDGTRDVSPWQTGKTVLDGKPAWVFTRTIEAAGKKSAPGGNIRGMTVRLWADGATYRAIRKETVTEFRDGREPERTVTTDFRYDETPPPGTFDLKPPKKPAAKKGK